MKRNRGDLSEDFGPLLFVIHNWSIMAGLEYGTFWLLATGRSRR